MFFLWLTHRKEKNRICNSSFQTHQLERTQLPVEVLENGYHPERPRDWRGSCLEPLHQAGKKKISTSVRVKGFQKKFAVR